MRALARALVLAAPLVAAACAATLPPPSFKSERERACYQRGRAAITTPGTELRRAGPGDAFVEATLREGFLVSTRRSEAFDACMASGTAAGPGPLSASGLEGPPITLTAADQAIWDRLTTAEKAEAVRFIRAGGTLAEWQAQRR